jgi:hypothetical protein
VRGTRDGTGLGRLRGADRRGAIVASLIVVGVAATAGALLNWHRGTLGVGVAARFGGLGAVGAMAVFAALAVVGTLVGARTASRARPDVLRAPSVFSCSGLASTPALSRSSRTCFHRVMSMARLRWSELLDRHYVATVPGAESAIASSASSSRSCAGPKRPTCALST